MNDDLSKLEEMLRNRAAEVSHVQEAPRTMLDRARRRIFRNALSSVAVAGILVVGVSTGIANLGASPGPDLVPPASSGGTSTCTAADLRATATLEGAAGSVVGSIDLTNLSAETCTLSGRPTVTLSSSSGDNVAVRIAPVDPQWQADGASPPPGWPVVRLRPGSAASIRVRWTNACPQLSDPASWTVDLGGGTGTLEVFGADSTFPPPCNGPTEPSTLEVGPFEPSGDA